jgi:hypothetical protein
MYVLINSCSLSSTNEFRMSRVTSLSRRLSTLPLLLFAALVTLTWTACSSAEVDLAIDSDFSLPVNQTLIVPGTCS